jgi:crotonobetainyl-CoA:carnitine CoA-transferase CaiB-like acyl-CoA transferase
MRMLDGVKILDLSRVLAGPWCTQILADLGADVIKVEMPGRGDDTRAWGPPYLQTADGADDLELSGYYLCCNRNKRSLAVNIADPRGADIIRALAAKADILVENFKVGRLARYGLDFDRLRAANPRLVYCSITGFGQTGPYADRPGYDFVAQGMAGFMSVTGEAGGQPLKAGVPMADLSTGMYAAVSILAALRHAERTGEGQHIDLALLDTQIAMLGNQSMNWLVGGTVPGPLGNRHPNIVPYRTFEVADGMIIIAVGNDGQFRQLCVVLGVAGLADDPRFATNRARFANREEIEHIIQDLVRGSDGAELVETLVAEGIPAGPVNSIKEIFEDPVIEARGTVHRFVDGDGREMPSVAFPAKLSATPADYRHPPPRVGEQSLDVLRDWLELDDGLLEDLGASGVIAQST